METTLRTERLTKLYGAERGITGLTLEVAKGEIFGLLGPNGAGKTTTTRLALDLIRPTSGSVEVLGLDAQEEALEIRKRVGYLPGDFGLYGDMTARRYLSHLARLRDMPDLEPAESLAGLLDLDLDRRMRQLSKGNRQKVGVVQAFMHKPDLLILDEPTSGLDPLVQQTFYGMVRQVRREGRTVFLSSHVMSEVEKVCDRVAVLKDGRMVGMGPVSALKRRAAREVDVRFKRPVAPNAVAAVPGVFGLKVRGDRMRFRHRGDTDALVKALAKYPVAELSIMPPSLEELFLSLYGGGKG
ncbi:MAG: ABC transporter ATP-binding protein [Euryarchaeota archaeon]|nr:ABC transporter ATP-binding protein [Euryarchaeota archaeon]